ncbi:hypothetical protein AQUCO_03500140v1 [Aquilegia coerulea]|uniref:Uncharacterized protein n=1 Tax=Aquilegia coerulea TaxID=218851 RepID=A0A2G5CWH2_AQUCA|nr:hypothetical protein AQUCO_03500140v1 [Aquilegia coerulea]
MHHAAAQENKMRFSSFSLMLMPVQIRKTKLKHSKEEGRNYHHKKLTRMVYNNVRNALFIVLRSHKPESEKMLNQADPEFHHSFKISV